MHPVISSVNELVVGAASFRAYNKVDYFKKELVKKVDCQSAAIFQTRVSSGWPKSRLELSFVLVLILVIVMMTIGKIK